MKVSEYKKALEANGFKASGGIWVKDYTNSPVPTKCKVHIFETSLPYASVYRKTNGSEWTKFSHVPLNS